MKIDQAQIYKLQWERENIYNAYKDFRKLHDQLSDKKLRKEVSHKLEILSARLTEFDRIFSILRIKI